MPSAALSHYLRRKRLLSKGGLIMAGGGLSSTFNAPLTTTLKAVKGVLNSFTRGNADATVTDFEGLIKDVKADEARFVGARRVANIVTSPEAVHIGGGTITRNLPDPCGNNTGIQVTNNGVTNSIEYPLDITKIISTSQDFIEHCFIRVLSGDVNDLASFILSNPNLASGAVNLKTIFLAEGTPNGEWLNVSSHAISPIAPNLWQTKLSMYQSSEAGGWVTVEIACMQLEEVTGQANQNPSEHVSVSVGTEEHEINPLMLDTDWGSDPQATYNNDGTVDFIGFAVEAEITAIPKVGALYAIAYTLSGTNIDFELGYGNESGTVRTSAGSYSEVLRASAANGALYVNSGTDTRLSGVSIKEVQHGSNVDGVKYFDTLNYNSVVDNVVNVLGAPTGAGIQWLTDPDMDINTILGEDTHDWTMPAAGQITGGKITLDQFNSLLGNLLPEAARYYRLEYLVSTGAWLTNPAFGGVALPLNIGVPISIIIKAINTNQFGGISGIGGITIEYFKLTPLASIPDDILKGVLIEEESKNTIPDSTLASWADGNASVNNGASTIKAPYGYYSEIERDVASGEVRFQGSIGTHGIVGNYTLSAVFNTNNSASDFTHAMLQVVANSTTGQQSNLFNFATKLWTRQDCISAGYIELTPGIFFLWVSDSDMDSTGGFNAAGFTDSDTITSSNGDLGDKGYIAMSQLEPLFYPTSHIPTSGSVANRLVEILTYEIPTSLLNADISYSIVMENYLSFDPILVPTDVYSFTIGKNTDYTGMFISNANAKANFRPHHNSVSVYPKTFAALTTGFVSLGYRFDTDDALDNAQIWRDGVGQQTATQSQPLTLTSAEKIHIGSSTGDTLQTNICTKNFKVYDKVVSDTKMQVLTS